MTDILHYSRNAYMLLCSVGDDLSKTINIDIL